MLAGGDCLLALSKVVLDAEEIVAVFELAVFGVQAPAADAGTQGDNHTICARFRHFDLGGHRI